LGVHFPDHDPQWTDADSLDLLARVVWLARERGWRVVNVDSTVMLERPRLRPFVQEMREKLAHTLEVEMTSVSVKAKTGEKMDAVGRGEAVMTQAVVLLTRV
jgi:2-C-methyl-D-erythritol 2,4-cyclodiphosphate synthase